MTNFDKKILVERQERRAEREFVETWLKTFAAAAIAFVLLLLACAMCGCRTTEYVPVETVRTEYKDRVNTEYIVDSVTDTRLVFIKGDTVIDWRDRVKWKEREVHDSIYINKADTIRVPYPVEKKLTKWEKAKMDFRGIAFGGTAVAVVAIAVLVWLARKYRK